MTAKKSNEKTNPNPPTVEPTDAPSTTESKDNADAPTTQSSKSAVPCIEVIAKVNGFYRAGLRWTIEPTVVVLADLSEAQLDELRNEPMLIVRDVDIAD
ncbi:MAG: HI1506-related protein [Burkholderiaceae bacterium]